MHTPLLLIAALLLGQGLPPGLEDLRSATYLDPDPSGPGWLGKGGSSATLAFYPDDPAIPACLVELAQVDLRHEADPGAPVARHDAIGRPCVLRAPRHRYADGGPARVDRGRLTVLGGLSPLAWSAALAHAHNRPPPPPDDPTRRLVEKGLANPRYATREAAMKLLVAKGADAVPALVQGTHHPDPEVRDRCEMALDSIRTGIME